MSVAARRGTPPPPQNVAVARGTTSFQSNSSKPFASSCPSDVWPRPSGTKSPSPRVNPVVTTSPRMTSKYLLEKNTASAATRPSATTLNARALSQVKEQSLSMAQRVDQIMKVPKIDARPEMYRVDVRQEEDLRKLHELQCRRDPEIASHKLAKSVGPAPNKTSFDIFGATEVHSVGGSSTAGRSDGHRHGNESKTSTPRSQKKHVGPLPHEPERPASGKRHVSPHASTVFPWEKESTVGKDRGKQTFPPAKTNPALMEHLTSSPICRTSSGRSTQNEGSVYELAQLPPPAASSDSPRRRIASSSPTGASLQRKGSSNLSQPDRKLQQQQQQQRPPSPSAEQPSLAPDATTAVSGLSGILKKSTHSASGKEEGGGSSSARCVSAVEKSSVSPSRGMAGDFPPAREASATFVSRPSRRTPASIAAFEASQPRNELPPKAQSARAYPMQTRRGGEIVDLNDTHFISPGQTSLDSLHMGPKTITIKGVTFPLRPVGEVKGRASSPPVSSNPNSMSIELPPPRRLARSATPPGGRRGSSGIFDVPTTNAKPSAAVVKKSMANLCRLLANNKTSDDNTLKSPSLEGHSAQEHASVNNAPLKRTLSSLQTSMVKPADTMKVVMSTTGPHLQKHRVASPHAVRIRESNLVASALSWS